jgi:hypothetical protein
MKPGRGIKYPCARLNAAIGLIEAIDIKSDFYGRGLIDKEE